VYRVILLLVAVALSACGSIEHMATPQQPLGKVLLAGPGDVVLRIDRERNLENVVGKADIWGRKTKEGFSEIRFAGVEESGVVVLYRKEIHVMTNETTLTRTPFSHTSGSSTSNITGTANTFGSTTQLSGTARTTGSATTISSGSDYHLVVPSDTIPIRLAPNERRVPISGYVIEIVSASPNSIEYRVLQTAAN
jgi:hypothetical protein